METSNAKVKKVDATLVKELKHCLQNNDKNAAVVFSICIEHFSKAGNRDLGFSIARKFLPFLVAKMFLPLLSVRFHRIYRI